MVTLRRHVGHGCISSASPCGLARAWLAWMSGQRSRMSMACGQAAAAGAQGRLVPVDGGGWGGGPKGGVDKLQPAPGLC